MRRAMVVAAVVAVGAMVVGAATFVVLRGGGPAQSPSKRWPSFADVVPAPVAAEPTPDGGFVVPAEPTIVTTQGSAEATAVGGYLAELLHAESPRPGNERPLGGIALLIDHADPAVATAEAYALEVDPGGVTIRASSGAGLFWGVQTLRQLIGDPATGPPAVPGGRIVDRPRFGYRGVMLDVARHFFDVSTVERIVDLAVLYKVNELHLHLSDDQGWRLDVPGRPKLASVGGSSQVGGGSGGYYTAEDYRRIVDYAADRYVTVVPEIDLPGHTNAALASYRELTCEGKAPAVYTGIEVGFSALCPTGNATYDFLEQVLGFLADATPGPYVHIGGDEARTLDPAGYSAIVRRAELIVAQHSKVAIGWHDVAQVPLVDGTVIQFWGTSSTAPQVADAVAAGHRVIMSPANRAYLDQKYDPSSPIGLSWAGPTSIEEAYDWDPAHAVSGVGEAAVLGVEAPLWTETVTTMDDIEYLMFPRLAAVAEIGWSPASTHDWSAFRWRLGAQAPRWRALGVDFAPVSGVAWLDTYS